MSWDLLINMFASFTIELIVGVLMLIKHPFKFRYKPYISITLGLLIPIATTVGVIVFLKYTCGVYYQWNEFVNILAYSIPVLSVCVATMLAYKVSISKMVVIVSISYTFQHIAYQLHIICFDTGLDGLLYSHLDYVTARTVSTFLTYLLKIGTYAGLYFLFARLFKKYSNYIIPAVNVVIIAALLYFVINVANTFVSLHLFWDAKGKAVIGGALLVSCLVFDSLIISNFANYARREENIIIQTTLNARMKQYEMLENNINFLNIKFHDLKKELKRIKNNDGKITDEDYELLTHIISLYDSGVKTGNVNIDALIQDKSIYCKSMDIEFTALVNGASFNDMDLADVYFLLTNIIDNAIEAVLENNDPEKRLINLTVSTRQGTIVIEQTNYTNRKLTFNKDGSLKTTKEDKKVHGYGTKSINYIVKKYDGIINYSIKDGIFTLKIII